MNESKIIVIDDPWYAKMPDPCPSIIDICETVENKSPKMDIRFAVGIPNWAWMSPAPRGKHQRGRVSIRRYSSKLNTTEDNKFERLLEGKYPGEHFDNLSRRLWRRK